MPSGCIYAAMCKLLTMLSSQRESISTWCKLVIGSFPVMWQPILALTWPNACHCLPAFKTFKGREAVGAKGLTNRFADQLGLLKNLKNYRLTGRTFTWKHFMNKYKVSSDGDHNVICPHLHLSQSERASYSFKKNEFRQGMGQEVPVLLLEHSTEYCMLPMLHSLYTAPSGHMY